MQKADYNTEAPVVYPGSQMISKKVMYLLGTLWPLFSRKRDYYALG